MLVTHHCGLLQMFPALLLGGTGRLAYPYSRGAVHTDVCVPDLVFPEQPRCGTLPPGTWSALLLVESAWGTPCHAVVLFHEGP